MKPRSIEELSFPDLFDGLYIGAIISSLEMILIIFIWAFNYFVMHTDNLEGTIMAMLFITNILIFVFLKHNNLFKPSIWKEINKTSKRKCKK